MVRYILHPSPRTSEHLHICDTGKLTRPLNILNTRVLLRHYNHACNAKVYQPVSETLSNDFQYEINESLDLSECEGNTFCHHKIITSILARGHDAAGKMPRLYVALIELDIWDIASKKWPTTT